jgi:hypothetical protein
MKNFRTLYIGKSGQLAVMSEFLLRGYNVAIPSAVLVAALPGRPVGEVAADFGAGGVTLRTSRSRLC